MSPDKTVTAVAVLSKTNMPIPLSHGELESKMIVPLSENKNSIEDMANVVGHIYMDILKRTESIPSLYDVWFDVKEHNEKLVYDHCVALVIKDSEDEDIDIDELDDMAEALAEEMYFSEFESLWDYNKSFTKDGGLVGTIMRILDTLSHSYTIDETTLESGIVFDVEDAVSSDLVNIMNVLCKKKGSIAVNSGQNLIFPELTVDGISGGSCDRGFLFRRKEMKYGESSLL